MRFSVDMRERVLNYIAKGNRISKASKIFEVSRVSIYKWLKLKKSKGRPEDDPRKRVFKKLDPEALKGYVAKNPDEMLKTYAAHFKVDPMAIFRAFKSLKITRKKRPCVTKKETKQNDQYF
jgi:putative transposase